MNEKKIQLKIFLKFLVICIFAGLYAWGGMEFKWLRRFLAPAILCFSMFGFTKDWKTLLQMPLMFGTLSLGYGAASMWGKILRRGIFGLANGFSSSTYNILKKRWLLVGIQVVLLVGLYIAIGVWNPFLTARAEESFLGLIIPIIAIMSAERS